MGFYEELSRYYDIIFPLTEDKLNFLVKDTDLNSRILDVACGTGILSIALAERGYMIDGIDLDSNMIEIAEKKARDREIQMEFKTGNMLDINEIFHDRMFGLIFCIGNSLVHLDNEKEVESFLHKSYDMLKVGGRVIIQIVNYDRILKYGIGYLPTISKANAGVEFIRKYVHIKGENKIYFNTELIVEKQGEKNIYTNSVPLIPMESNQIVDLFNKAGFIDIKVYGGFNEEEYNEQSYATVVSAVK